MAALEVPLVATDGGKVVADLILVNDAAAHMILCESKSGANIEVDQAKRYARVLPKTVVQGASITLPGTAEPSVETLYLGLEVHSERLALSLTSADVDYPLLTVAEKAISLTRREHASSLLQSALPERGVELLAPPVSYIPFDHDDLVEVFVSPVRAQLIKMQAAGEPSISCHSLTERTCAHFLLYGVAARAQLIKKVTSAARQIATEFPSTYQYHQAPGGGEGVIHILRTPEAHDARGRTQAYQALARPHTPRRRRAVDPNQLDLLQELEGVDESGDDDMEERP
ncbi:hypothetical protein ADK94_26840 [Streptomyces sp. XY593]|uniref:hypothetical protein n=1 Tax=Streptomyces sp. XY593 TaxID=1519483 RepID=UPI0006AEDEEB|nr:hypothetical protein [Streptomyces sp. XY593]KOU81333.1 hypothetical protein ADK94_26840 [Streptomyces sp. XY593]